MSYEDNSGYAQGRLSHTAVLYRDKVVYVTELFSDVAFEEGEDEDDEPQVVGEIVANITYADGTRDNCPLKELDITPLPTGYYEDNGRWLFCARSPTRKWKQGLSEENCAVAANGEPMFAMLPIGNGLQQIYDKNYKTKEQAFRSQGAFSRSFCVEGGKLYYQAEHVGNLKDGVLEWLPNKSYLQRRLERTE